MFWPAGEEKTGEDWWEVVDHHRHSTDKTRLPLASWVANFQSHSNITVLKYSPRTVKTRAVCMVPMWNGIYSHLHLTHGEVTAKTTCCYLLFFFAIRCTPVL